MKRNYITFTNPDDLEVLPESEVFYNTKLQRLSVPETVQSKLDTDIHKYIKQNYPNYYHVDITKPKESKITHMDNLFNEFSKIESNKHQHNLKWALKRATDEFTYDQLKKAHKTTDCFGAFDEVILNLRKESKSKINKLSRRFSFLSNLVSILDIVVSVALILIVTILSHLGDKLFNTVLVSTLFIGLVALTKVSLDRFAIMPLIDNYGWRLFRKSINYARDESIKINAIYCVLMESIASNEPVETRYQIIDNQNKDVLDNTTDLNSKSSIIIANLS